MNVLRLFLISLSTAAGMCGCLQIEKVVKLKPDGSGTIEEKVVMSKETVSTLQRMAAGFPKSGDQKGTDQPFALLDEKKLRSEAEKMGEGVKFVSAKKIDSETSDGYAAIFSFGDINKIKVDQNPGGALPGPSGGKGGAGQSRNEPITFHFTQGRPAELAITMPQPAVKSTPKSQDDGTQEMAMQMMKQIFKDMKISVALEIQGTIRETNAAYREGSRVTLIEMDFNKLLADPEKFKTLAKQNPQSLQETKALLKGLDGVKIETAPEVKVKFQ